MARERDDYDDYDNKPRRRDDRDDDDGGPRSRPVQQLTGLDKTFHDTNIVVLILFALCCNGIALVLGVIGLITCKDETAKKNALIVTIIGGIITALAVVGRVMQAVGGN
jgi:hypothetical protein